MTQDRKALADENAALAADLEKVQTELDVAEQRIKELEAALRATPPSVGDVEAALRDLDEAHSVLRSIASGYGAEDQTELSTSMASDAGKALDLLTAPRAILSLYPPGATAGGTKSAPDFQAPHNSGERLHVARAVRDACSAEARRLNDCSGNYIAQAIDDLDISSVSGPDIE